MDALRSLVSYRGAMWAWEQTPTSSGFRYRLRRPKPAQDLAGSVRDWAQAQFEQSLDVLIAAAQASPEARKAGAATLNAALWRDPNDNADRLLGDERCWDGFRCVADALPADERGAALRKGVNKRIPVGDLPPATQEFVMREWRTADAHRRIGPNGPIEKVPPPTFITVRTNDGTTGDPTPALLLGLEGLGEYAWAGGTPLDRASCRHLGSSWRHEGDAAGSAMLDRTCRRTDAELPTCEPAAAYRALQMAEWAEVNLMLRLPESGCSINESADGRTVGAYLATLRSSLSSLQWKVREDVLLVTDHRWLWFDGTELPYRVIRALQATAVGSSEAVDLGLVFPVIAALTGDQFRALDHRFPMARWLHGLLPVADAVGTTPAALRELQSTAGARIATHVASKLTGADASAARGAVASARVTIGLDTRGPQVRTARCEVKVGAAPWALLAQFRYPMKAAPPTSREPRRQPDTTPP
jgi:hypothetical protein